ncbi:MAG: thiamine-phosphate kinase [Planctomycetota bacterium]
MSWREFDLIRGFRTMGVKDPSVLVGPGDDCAVLRFGKQKVVLTTDMIQEGTDFLPDTPLFKVGWKAVMISASDVAAMGCSPTHFVIASALPSEMSQNELDQLWHGLYSAAETVGASIVGGDLSKGPELTLVSTALGVPFGDEPILRSTASVGDKVCVSGPLGGSILGHHLDFVARVDFAEVLAVSGYATSAIDISDGLSGDLVHIAEESGLGFELFAEAIPISLAAKKLSLDSGKSALSHALHDGEDFELLFTVPPAYVEQLKALCSGKGLEMHIIGEMKSKDEGWLISSGGITTPLEIRSYAH